MTPAKAAILDRIRAVERVESPAPSRSYRRAGALDADERVALFCERVADYRAEVHRVSDVAAAIEGICGGRRFGVPPGLRAAWRPASAVEDDGFGAEALDALDGVVTACTVGIAETGTIVLAGGAEEGRRALTLVPDLHVCVVESEQIVEVLPQAIAVVEGLVAHERRPLTLISGPSATSDIELSRVEGVHGPRALIVLVVAEER